MSGKKQETNNSAEMARLKKEIATQETIKDKLNADISDKAKEISSLRTENVKFKATLTAAYEKIKKLEEVTDKSVQGIDNVREGYVTIASCPLPNGVRPHNISVDGILVPRTIDEDGIVYEDVPVATAVGMLSEGSGFARYLVKPVNSIKGNVRAGLYIKEAIFYRHKKSKDVSGKVVFERILAE
jgi:hypothetical protein